jgi:imidazolonepropionase-like amidohydrolase
MVADGVPQVLQRVREALRMGATQIKINSLQPLLDDEDAISFPEGSFSRQKYIQVTEGNDRVYRLAKKIGVKTIFGIDALFDPGLAAHHGKVLAKLSRWSIPVEALRQATPTAGELLARSGPRNPYREGPRISTQGAEHHRPPRLDARRRTPPAF